jgi:phospholipase C
VFGKLAEAGQTWKIYGYSTLALTANDFADTVHRGARGTVELGFDKFQRDAANGQLAAFS